MSTADTERRITIARAALAEVGGDPGRVYLLGGDPTCSVGDYEAYRAMCLGAMVVLGPDCLIRCESCAPFALDRHVGTTARDVLAGMICHHGRRRQDHPADAERIETILQAALATTRKGTPMSTARLYGMPGFEAKYPTPLAAFEARAWELPSAAGEASRVVEEWTVRSAGTVLPSAAVVIATILNEGYFAMQLPGRAYKLLEDAVTDQVRRDFQLALDRWAVMCQVQIADQLVGVHVVTLDGNGNPSFARQPFPAERTTT